MHQIPFNRPFVAGNELDYIRAAIDAMHLAGGGDFTARCQRWLEGRVPCLRALLTHSCTAALEMAAILVELEPGDEVILPSYTFVSTANAFVLRGAVPVFVDIRPDTLNIDETRIEAAITSRTRAIVPVHYAGVACEMDTILAIATARGLLVIEDAAQGIMSTYKGKALGGLGHLGAVSFHETKNLISGEGGALLVNDARWSDRAGILAEKGTNRSSFLRGEVDKYTWVDIGSSYLPSEIIAAFLWAQMEKAEELTRRRIAVWNRYQQAFADLELCGRLRRPMVPPQCQANAHMYYLLLSDLTQRSRLIRSLSDGGIHAVFHYVPLHSSPAGRRYGRVGGELVHTDSVSERLVRLPLWTGMTEVDVARVVDAVHEALA